MPETADFDRLAAVIATELELEPGDISPSSSQDSVEYWDSLGHLRVCMGIEREFGTRISVDDAGKLTSVDAILSYLSSASGR